MLEFEGKLIVVAAPSGAGKTTIVRHLLHKFDFLDFSISATTRQKREYETEGQDYYFVTPAKFMELIEDNAFAEYEMVYTDQFYGTLLAEMDRIWEKQKHIIFDIDVQGAMTLKRKFGERCLTIFVKPPSREALVERLTHRNTESFDNLQKRIFKASHELKYERFFDYVLFNNVLEVACEEAEEVVRRFVMTSVE